MMIIAIAALMGVIFLGIAFDKLKRRIDDLEAPIARQKEDKKMQLKIELDELKKIKEK